MAGRIKMESANTPSANEPTKDHIIRPHILLKPMIKAQISGRIMSSGISGAVIASLHFEKSRLKKCMMIMIMIIIIMNKSQDHYESVARKVMVDFKFDALYR